MCMWITKRKYETISDVGAGPNAEGGDTVTGPERVRRMDEFQRDARVYNWPLIAGLIVTALILVLLLVFLVIL